MIDLRAPFPAAETIKIAQENEWWDIEEAFQTPKNATEFYALWEQLTNEYKGLGNVECFIPLVGHFDFRGGEIYRFFPSRRNPINQLLIGGCSHNGPASLAELNEIDWAIKRGMATLQVIYSPLSGMESPEVLLYGTGKPFGEA